MATSLPLRSSHATPPILTIGVLALQGAFHEHILLLHQAAAVLATLPGPPLPSLSFPQIRTPAQLASCDALILPGGESTTMSLVAARSALLDPLRAFVKTRRLPVWGTCAGLILLAEAADRTKRSGQDLIGGLDVRVLRNRFGRQAESFEALLDLPFLGDGDGFRSVFIRAPVVVEVLEHRAGEQAEQAALEDTVVAPSRAPEEARRHLVGEAVPVEVMARLPGGAKGLKAATAEEGDIVAVRQGNVFGTSFHPELTGDPRIHVWWLRQVIDVHRSSSG